MRVHAQNEPNEALSAVTEERWRRALARSGADEAAWPLTIAENKAGFAAGIKEAEALIALPATVQRLLPGANAPRLRLVFVTAAGVDALAPFTALPQTVSLLNSRGIHAAKASEYVLMAILMLANHLPEYIADQRAHRWYQRHASSVRRRRLTVLGLGAIGGAAAERAAALGIEVTGLKRAVAPHPACVRVLEPAALDSVLLQTDFLLLSCPLTAATRGIMDRRRLGLLPRGAGVINIARGALIDQDALADLLFSGHLGGAVLDVTDPEPLPPQHPLWAVPNLVLTPHVSADDPESYVADALDLFFAGAKALAEGRRPPTLVDRARGY